MKLYPDSSTFHNNKSNGEGKRRNEFAEWHNYAKYDIRGMT